MFRSSSDVLVSLHKITGDDATFWCTQSNEDGDSSPPPSTNVSNARLVPEPNSRLTARTGRLGPPTMFQFVIAPLNIPRIWPVVRSYLPTPAFTATEKMMIATGLPTRLP